MDDRTHNTLDSLADLFLTQEPHADALSGPASIKLPPKAARPSHTMAEPPDPTLGELDELTRELLGVGGEPAHIDAVTPPDEAASESVADSSTPKPAADPSASDYQQEPATPTPAVSHDQPTAPAGHALRLAGGDDQQDGDHNQQESRSGRRDRPTVGVAEAVMLGNLPGMAGPWLTQYGQRRAQAGHAVAILHVDADGIDLELIEPTRHHPGDAESPAAIRAEAGSVRVPPGGFAGRDLIAVLDQLAGVRVSPLRTVLVHLDATAAALPRLLDLPTWTLLSGADDAAVAAGQRLLQQLSDADERTANAHVGLMIVGSDEPTSLAAAAKLVAATAECFHAAPQRLGHQQKMIPARCRTLGHFAGLDSLWPRLTAWLEALQPPAPTQAESLAQDAQASKPRHPLPPLQEPVRVQAPNPHPRPQTPDPTLDLFHLIDSDPRAAASIPGGLPLEARCPSQPHTQLAVDSLGRLHLLHRHDSDHGDPPTPKEAIVELVAVRDWARQHRQLLQLTERGRRFDPDADPILHLFTDRADLSVHLVSRLGELLKLHLLRDVTVGDQQTYFCTPLSA